VTLRESYTRAQLQADYNELFLFTAPRLRTALKNEWQFSSPSSPYVRYGELGTADVHIKTITFLGANIGQVRYYVLEHKGGTDTRRHMVATMEFQYVAAPASEEARGIDPLGFVVTSWRTDPESAPEEEGEERKP
jgi:type IV secretion system protein VirB8